MPRTNKLQPYIAQIKTFIEEGMTYTEMMEKLFLDYDLDVTEGHLSIFVNRNGLKTKKSEYNENVPRCNSCDKCYFVTKAYTDEKQRICFSDMHLIRNECETSPMWCPKREGTNGNL